MTGAPKNIFSKTLIVFLAIGFILPSIAPLALHAQTAQAHQDEVVFGNTSSTDNGGDDFYGIYIYDKTYAKHIYDEIQ